VDLLNALIATTLHEACQNTTPLLFGTRSQTFGKFTAISMLKKQNFWRQNDTHNFQPVIFDLVPANRRTAGGSREVVK
jgi:hypothetical protein